jgi:hypothetical protein
MLEKNTIRNIKKQIKQKLFIKMLVIKEELANLMVI